MAPTDVENEDLPCGEQFEGADDALYCKRCNWARECHKPAATARRAEMPTEQGPYFDAALANAQLVTEKQAAYGDSFGKAGRILRELYPSGVSIDQLDDALTITRVVDKLFRVATKKDAFGESPWKDIMGYALLAVVRDGKK